MNKPLKVKKAYIKGQTDPIRDCVVFILDNFVIIARNQNDNNPTWYNVNLIEKLEDVTAETYKTRIG